MTRLAPGGAPGRARSHSSSSRCWALPWNGGSGLPTDGRTMHYPDVRALGRPARRRLVWWFAFLSFACLGAAWVFATPINAAPDERDHMLRAAAVAQGELVAKKGAVVRGTGAVVTAPASFSALMAPA